MKRFMALLLLALQFWVHVFSWPVRWLRPRGFAAFRRHYLREGLVPLSPHAHERLPAVSACLSCGACDVMLPSALPPLSHRIAAYARSGPDFGLVCAEVEELREVDTTAFAALCPTGVDLEALISWVSDGARAAREEAEANSGLPRRANWLHYEKRSQPPRKG